MFALRSANKYATYRIASLSLRDLGVGFHSFGLAGAEIIWFVVNYQEDSRYLDDTYLVHVIKIPTVILVVHHEAETLQEFLKDAANLINLVSCLPHLLEP